MASNGTPRRPVGGRALGGPRPRPALQLGIPPGNVPGINVDQIGENGWTSASGQAIIEPFAAATESASSPSIPFLGERDACPSASTPDRFHMSPAPSPGPPPKPSGRKGLPALSLSVGNSPAPSPLPTSQLQTPPRITTKPSLSLLTPPIIGGASRPRTPQLSLNLNPPPNPPPPLLPGQPSGDDYLFPNDRTVKPLSMDSDAGSAYGSYGGYNSSSAYQSFASSSQDNTILPTSSSASTVPTSASSSMASMTSDLKNALSGMSLNQERSYSSSSSSMTSKHSNSGNGTGIGGFMDVTPPSSISEKDPSATFGDLDHGGTGQSGLEEGVEKMGMREAPPVPSQGTSSSSSLQVLGFDPDDLVDLAYLGEGAGGAVIKVREKKTGRVMAKKSIQVSPNPSIHRQILRELQFLNTCISPSIVSHYGSFISKDDTTINILMEFAEGKSLDAAIKKTKEMGVRTSSKVLGKVAENVLKGLDYLHGRKIVHRDIKPSNILITRSGQFKICDFGVSGELENSVADTFTGTSFYMAPERILGQGYSIKSDIWSTGLTLLETAYNRFPFPEPGEPPIIGQFDLLNVIVNQNPPELKDDEDVQWNEEVKSFIKFCLIKDAASRPYPRDLLLHPFIKRSESINPNMERWVSTLWGWS